MILEIIRIRFNEKSFNFFVSVCDHNSDHTLASILTNLYIQIPGNNVFIDFGNEQSRIIRFNMTANAK